MVEDYNTVFVGHNVGSHTCECTASDNIQNTHKCLSQPKFKHGGKTGTLILVTNLGIIVKW